MSTCLVTGAAGFVGSHLCEALLDQHHTVIGIDAFTDNYSRQQKKAALAKVQHHRRSAHFSFIFGDIGQMDLSPYLQEATWVFHLAAEPGVRRSWGAGFPPYLERNVAATQILLEACREYPLKKFVLASSSSVYGERKRGISAEDDPCAPFSPYGVTKLAAEHLALAYHKNFSLPVVVLRYFTIFGPRQRPDMAFHRLLKQAMTNVPLRVFGDGTQSRDFTYVGDAAKGTVQAAAYGKPGAVYNIGGGIVTSVNDVVALIQKNFPSKTIRVRHVPKSPGDVAYTASDCKKAQVELGFKPETSLEMGLLRELRWLRGFITARRPRPNERQAVLS